MTFVAFFNFQVIQRVLDNRSTNPPINRLSQLSKIDIPNYKNLKLSIAQC